MEQNRKAGQNPPRVVAPTEEEEEEEEGRGDETICFCCGVGIHEWLPLDNAWREHGRWSPHCVFVRYIRGPAFVRESRRLGSLQNTDLTRR